MINVSSTARPGQADFHSLATPRQRELLSLVLDRQMQSGHPVPAPPFRAEHHADRKALDALEHRQLLRRTGDKYRVTGLALPLCASNTASQLISSVERVFGLLSAHYIEFQATPVQISNIVDKTDLSTSEVVQSIEFLQDVGPWYGGGSIDLSSENANVCCREEILDFKNFKKMAAEVLSWSAGVQTLPSPELLSTASVSRQFQGGVTDSGLAHEGTLPKGQTEAKSGDFTLAWQAARSCLQEFKFDEIKDIVGLAGLSLPSVAHLVQRSVNGATKGQLMTALDEQVGAFEKWQKARMVTTVIEEVLRRKDELQDKLSEYLSRLGWSFFNGTLLPIEVLDTDDLEFVPASAQKDLLKAAQRMRDGDVSGAISAACGAVDAATSKVYDELGLGDPGAASFQERCRKAVQAKGLLVSLELELSELGWQPKDVVPFKKNLEGALNQGAYVLQTLRSNMGDVHGTKPITRSLAFEALKWSELIVAALANGRVNR